MKENQPLVGIFGLKKDKALLETAAEVLDSFEVPYEIQTFTARNVHKLASKYAEQAEEKGLHIIIASDRPDNSISSIFKTITMLPVIVIPTITTIEHDNTFQTAHNLLTILSRTPTAIMSINTPGAINSGLSAVSILALNNPEISEKYHAFREKQTQDVLDTELP